MGRKRERSRGGVFKWRGNYGWRAVRIKYLSAGEGQEDGYCVKEARMPSLAPRHQR